MFAFHPELFEDRTTAIEALAAKGFDWFVHFSAIDLLHDRYGLEICGIPEEVDAESILQIMKSIFLRWPHSRVTYQDRSRDRGWKVEIFKRAKKGGDWKTA